MRKLSLFFSAVMRSKEAERCRFIKRLILLYFHNRLPFLNMLISGGCSCLEVIDGGDLSSSQTMLTSG